MTVCPAYGDGAILGSFLMVEARSDTDSEVGELLSEAVEPEESGKSSDLTSFSQHFTSIISIQNNDPTHVITHEHTQNRRLSERTESV